MYRNIISQIDRPQDFVEYQLQKYYNFRVQALTHTQVEEMSAQVEAIIAEHIPLAASADENPAKGKRSDHDCLPDEIKAKYVENLSILQRMRELHRWNRRFLYPLHRLRKIPLPRYFFPLAIRRFIKIL